MSNSMVVYQTDSGAEVKLSPSIIRQYLVNGGGKCSDQEIMMFLMLCKQQRLDPFLREAYLIKYGSENPATIVTGKEVFTKRAERHPQFRGMVAGVVVQAGDSGELTYRPGSLVLAGESLVGGWAKVWKAEREVPYENAVTFDEYVGKKKNGEINRQWSTKPATMIRKVALVQTLRETFPETFSGMYDADEMSHVQSDTLDDAPVSTPKDVTPEPTQPIGEKVTIKGKPTGNLSDTHAQSEPDTLTDKDDAVIADAKGKVEMLDGINRTAEKADENPADGELGIF